ncbi:MAG: UDP-N-acetylglucosamine 1-carboxyvinyltransferase [Oscillospiraceae bacterium]|nr:UDP-N-acetylglucosamine 1-carboxyvinyltransferase [Oscillospiraceae bacterium]
MSKLVITGGKKLEGEIFIHGAKNSALPILAATIMCRGETIIHNCPQLSDVEASIKILKYLGCKVSQDKDTVTVNSTNIINSDIPENLMHEMRSSIIFLGALLARCKKTKLSFPGGCELGPRPIDLHIAALKKMGVEITEEHGFLNCSVKNKLKGSKIALSFPSVGATENILLAAASAKGKTIITNAAREPEIVDLANFLISCGAKIKGAGSDNIYIEGVSRLTPCEHVVIPDRIAASTFMSAIAITRGDVLVKNVEPKHLSMMLPIFEEAGCKLNISEKNIKIKNTDRLNKISTIRTMPYPGFPTDLQAPTMAMMTLAKGTSIFVENIFENRYKHVCELNRLGAKISVEGKVAVVYGVDSLSGAITRCTDLRGGASLVVAALAAEGKTEILDISHIDRGYNQIEETLKNLGADISREKDISKN